LTRSYKHLAARVAFAYVAIGVLAGALVGFTLGSSFAPVRHEVKRAKPAPVMTLAALQRVNGTPDQIVAGTTVNKNLAGLTCYVYKAGLVACAR